MEGTLNVDISCEESKKQGQLKTKNHFKEGFLCRSRVFYFKFHFHTSPDNLHEKYKSNKN